METLLSKHWHHLPEDEVCDLLQTDPEQGLDVFEAKRRFERFGPNVITEKAKQGRLARFLLQLHQPLVYILLVAAGITAFLREWVDAGVILGVVIVNAVIGFLQESKALRAIEALAKTMTTEATVIRAGKRQVVTADTLVPGDVVVLQSGDKVPVDMRLTRVRDLQVDESALTGESVPVIKCDDVLEHDAVLASRRNMAFASTLVTYGQATGVTTSTGDGTEVGRISQLISGAEALQTPLTRRIAQFSHVLLYAVIALAALTFAVGLVRGESAVGMFMAAVALAVGAIPEGLPAALTITLAIGVSRLAARRAVIRKLPAVETLGSTTVICSDKTGTLTQNQMTVTSVFAGGESFEVTGTGFAPDGEVSRAGADAEDARGPALVECLRSGLLCNDSDIVEDGGRWTVQGDPTEGALVAVAAKAGLAPDETRAAWPRVDAIPFESQHQYMATLHAREHDEGSVLYIKGSAESVLDRCDDALGADGGRERLEAEAVRREVERMAARGLRVLACASKELPAAPDRLGHQDVGSGLTFLGLQGMIDPPRPEVIAAVDTCQSAGIRVKMITGDHPVTAAAIARQVGIDGAGAKGRADLEVVTGAELSAMTDDQLVNRVDQIAVFARTTPEQKLQLVEALQTRDHVVAMTGDGVNDAPALKRADIGVAMGVSGTDVSREAADMVLTDDNFASIEAAVEEGRGVFDNLTKFIVWTLPTNLGEGLVILLAVILGATLPILPLQILWINMTTAVLLGLMLAFEPKEPGIMTRRPRDPRTPILTGALLGRIGLVGALLLVASFGLFEWELARGASLEQARTVAVNVFVIVELFYLFNCRSLTRSMFHLGLFTNRWIFVGVLAMLALQLMFTYLPAMNHLFQSEPIGLAAWGRIVAAGLVGYAIVGLEKQIRARSLTKKGRRPAPPLAETRS